MSARFLAETAQTRPVSLTCLIPEPKMCADGGVRITFQGDDLALPRPGEARRRWYGSCLQSPGHAPGSFCCLVPPSPVSAPSCPGPALPGDASASPSLRRPGWAWEWGHRIPVPTSFCGPVSPSMAAPTRSAFVVALNMNTIGSTCAEPARSKSPHR